MRNITFIGSQALRLAALSAVLALVAVLSINVTASATTPTRASSVNSDNASSTVKSLGLANTSAKNLSARTTGGCSGGVRCWVNLTRAETWAVGWGPIPAPPGVVARTPLLNAAYYTLAYGHRYIARGWYNRGMCVQFVFSAIPWEGRGMNGLRC